MGLSGELPISFSKNSIYDFAHLVALKLVEANWQDRQLDDKMGCDDHPFGMCVTPRSQSLATITQKLFDERRLQLRLMVSAQHNFASPQYRHQYAAQAPWSEDQRGLTAFFPQHVLAGP